MTELSLLSNDELLYLKYIILREASNYSNNYIMATKFDNQLSKLKITNKKDLKIDFKDYEKIIYKILLNKTSDINIDLLTDKDKRELIDLLDKVLYIFSINKEENINKYNELELYKKQVFKRLKKYDLKEILSLLDNPLDNDNLIIELNNQMLNKAIPDSRKLYLNKDNPLDFIYDGANNFGLYFCMIVGTVMLVGSLIFFFIDKHFFCNYF